MGNVGGTVVIPGGIYHCVSITLPDNVNSGETIHVICEVTDNGTSKLTRYQRVIISIEKYLLN